MPIKMKTDIHSFFRDLNDAVEKGRPAYEVSDRWKVSTGTITYRLNKFSLEMRRAEGLFHKHTGRSFREMDAAGEFELVTESVAQEVSAV